MDDFNVIFTLKLNKYLIVYSTKIHSSFSINNRISLSEFLLVIRHKLGSSFLLLLLDVLGPTLELLGTGGIEGNEGELILVLEEGSKFEIVLRVEGTLHGHVVLEQLQELLLQLVDLVRHEERIDEREIRITQVLVVPHLLGHEQRTKDERSPVSGIKWHPGKGNQSVDVDETDDAALGREEGTVVEGLHEFVDVFDGGGFAEEGSPGFVELFGFFLDVLFLAEEVEVGAGGDLLAGVLVLEHLGVEDGRHRVDHTLHIRGGNRARNVQRGRRVELFSFTVGLHCVYK